MLISPYIMAISASALLVSAHIVDINDRNLYLHDIIETGAHPNKIISELPTNKKGIVLTEVERLQLLRKAYPNIRFRLRHQGDVLYQVAISKINSKKKFDNCYTANNYIPAGTQIRMDWLDKVACKQDKNIVSIGFDRQARVAIATQDIFSGSYLGRLYLPNKQTIRQGDKLIFITENGPVIIQREVTALQGVQSGQKIFVKTKDGTILSSKFFSKITEGSNEKK